MDAAVALAVLATVTVALVIVRRGPLLLALAALGAFALALGFVASR